MWALRVHDESRAAEARRRTASLEASLARIELPVDVPADVTVVFDGRRVERRQPQFLEPGEYELVADAPGKQPWRARLLVRPGALTLVAVPALAPLPVPVEDLPARADPSALQPRIEASPAPGAVTLVQVPPPPSARQRKWSWVTLGLAGASMVTAVALHVSASNDYEVYKSLNPGQTRNETGERSRLFYQLSWGFYGGAGAVGLASLLLFLLE